MRRSILLQLVWVIAVAANGVVAFAQDDEAAHKQAVRAAYAEYSADNPYALSNILREPFMMNQGDATLVETTYIDVIDYDTALFGAMPDLQSSPEVLIAQDDWVAAYVVHSGTYTQPYNFEPLTGSEPLPPTNETVLWTELIFFHFDESNLVDELWAVSDPSVLFGQLGIMPVDTAGEMGASPMDAPVGFQAMGEDALSATYASDNEERNLALFNEQLALGLGVFPEYYVDPYISWSNGRASSVSAEAALADAEFLNLINQAMPDMTIEPIVVVAEGDWVAALISFNGTFTGTAYFNGTPLTPTNEEVGWLLGGMSRYNSFGELIVEEVVEGDFSPVVFGLGLMPLMIGGE